MSQINGTTRNLRPHKKPTHLNFFRPNVYQREVRFLFAGESVGELLWFIDPIWYETHAGTCKHMQQRSFRSFNEGSFNGGLQWRRGLWAVASFKSRLQCLNKNTKPYSSCTKMFETFSYFIY